MVPRSVIPGVCQGWKSFMLKAGAGNVEVQEKEEWVV